MIEKLKHHSGFWPILALDHGLTSYRDAVPLGRVRHLLGSCSPYYSAVVMTYGLARTFHGLVDGPALIVQCFGAPAGIYKVNVCDVEAAIEAGAKGVAVQIDFSLAEDSLAKQVASISAFVTSAHRASLPVLFMVSNRALSSLDEMLNGVRICHELGADLIKISCDHAMICGLAAMQIEPTKVFEGGPPVLLAGGERHEGLTDALKASKKIGFSGYCVGRNVYQSENPVEISKLLNDCWIG